MAGPTTQQLSDRLDKHAEEMRDLGKTVAILEERIDNLRTDLKGIDETLNRITDALAKLTAQLAAVEGKLTAQLAAVEARLTALEKTVDEIKKSNEERDRKQWMFWVAVIAAILAFIGNLAIALIRR